MLHRFRASANAALPWYAYVHVVNIYLFMSLAIDGGCYLSVGCKILTFFLGILWTLQKRILNSFLKHYFTFLGSRGRLLIFSISGRGTGCMGQAGRQVSFKVSPFGKQCSKGGFLLLFFASCRCSLSTPAINKTFKASTLFLRVLNKMPRAK